MAYTGDPRRFVGAQTLVVYDEDIACERGANISPTTCGHARVNRRHLSPSVCGAFVAAVTRACPRFPRPPQDGKEEAVGSSPTEGLEGSCKSTGSVAEMGAR